MNAMLQTNIRIASAIFALCVLSSAANAQSKPIKPGLWETQSTISHTMTLPPEAEARIAAMPPAQQAQVRAMVGGGAGGTPVVVTTKTCIAPGSTLDTMLDRSKKNPGMACSFTNRIETASGASFDSECTGSAGNAKGHTELRSLDADHVTMTTHVAMTSTSQGRSMNSTVDSTATARYLGADCGDVKPLSTPAAK